MMLLVNKEEFESLPKLTLRVLVTTRTASHQSCAQLLTALVHTYNIDNSNLFHPPASLTAR